MEATVGTREKTDGRRNSFLRRRRAPKEAQEEAQLGAPKWDHCLPQMGEEGLEASPSHEERTGMRSILMFVYGDRKATAATELSLPSAVRRDGSDARPP